jgi:hypothetical protein
MPSVQQDLQSICVHMQHVNHMPPGLARMAVHVEGRTDGQWTDWRKIMDVRWTKKMDVQPTNMDSPNISVRNSGTGEANNIIPDKLTTANKEICIYEYRYR